MTFFLGQKDERQDGNTIQQATKTHPLDRLKLSILGYNFRGGADPIFTQQLPYSLPSESSANLTARCFRRVAKSKGTVFFWPCES